MNNQLQTLNLRNFSGIHQYFKHVMDLIDCETLHIFYRKKFILEK